MYKLGISREDLMIVNVAIENHNMEMKVHTGASVTVMSEESFRQRFTSREITPANAMLRIYSGELIKPIGVAEVEVNYNR